jgi:hypothetical protein
MDASERLLIFGLRAVKMIRFVPTGGIAENIATMVVRAQSRRAGNKLVLNPRAIFADLTRDFAEHGNKAGMAEPRFDDNARRNVIAVVFLWKRPKQPESGRISCGCRGKCCQSARTT